MAFGYIAVLAFISFGKVFSQTSTTSDASRPAVYFIAEPPSDVTAFENASAYLNCSAASFDGSHVTVTWRKDGVDAMLDSGGRRSVTSSGALVIAPVVRRYRMLSSGSKRWKIADEGFYECVARTERGAAVSSPSRLRVATLSGKFTVSPQDTRVTVGQSVRFECAIDGWPVPVISWLKDGRRLDGTTNDRVTILETLGVVQLEAVVATDQGVYSCEAVNDVDKRTSSGATLTVDDLQSEQPPGARLIFRPPSRLSLTIETPAVVECFVSGLPRSAVSWTRLDADSSVIGSSPSDRVRVVGLGNLYFQSVQESDGGSYRCSWTDHATSEMLPFHVNISIATPPLPLGSHNMPLLEAITKRRHGQMLHLRCRFDGQPTPEIVWLINGSSITGQHSRIRVDVLNDGTSELSIERTNIADSGMYQCRANNSVGFSQQSTWVDVHMPEIVLTSVVHVTAIALSSTSIKVMWDEPPENSTIPVIAYSVHYFTPGVKEIQRVVRTPSETITGLKPNTTYTIFVTAYAQTGRSPPSEFITASTLPDVGFFPVQNGSQHTTLTRIGAPVTIGPVPDDPVSVTHENSFKGFTDPQLGVIIGSCIGFTCIAVSIMIVVIRARSRGMNHTGHMANGSVPMTRTVVCRCQLMHPGGGHLVAYKAPSPTEEHEIPPLPPAIPLENQNCDTKGGYLLGHQNGKVKSSSGHVNGRNTSLFLPDAEKQNHVSDPSQAPLLGQKGTENGDEAESSRSQQNSDDLDGIDYDLSDHDGEDANGVVENDDVERQSCNSLPWKQAGSGDVGFETTTNS